MIGRLERLRQCWATTLERLQGQRARLQERWATIREHLQAERVRLQQRYVTTVREQWQRVWHPLRDNGEIIGFPLLILGFGVLLVQFFLVLGGLRTETGLLGAALGLISVGLGFIAVGMNANSDKRHTELLKAVQRDVRNLPKVLSRDRLDPLKLLFPTEEVRDEVEVAITQRIAEEVEAAVAAGVEREVAQSEASRAAAQKRIDEDTARVGYVRGEVYQLEDGSWAVHWGGKYPL